MTMLHSCNFGSRKQFIILLFVITAIFMHVSYVEAAQDTVCSDVYSGWNLYRHNYQGNCAAVIQSYLTVCSDGKLMRVQSLEDNTVLIEYYNDQFKLLDKKTFETELPLWGGFYSDGTNHYILSGQLNPDEDENVDVFCITKYDSNWKKLGSCGIKGGNTVIPFRAGSARFAMTGKYLAIRTSHRMYKSGDGRNHQANVSILVDTETMTITDSFYSVMNLSYAGYVSHSFNQFVQIDNNQVVAVDHGDAYPRTVVLIKFDKDITGGSFIGSNKSVSMLDIAGDTGANYTGVDVGGFEVSDSHYLVVGRSIRQGDDTSAIKDIFISSVDRDLTQTPVYTKLTTYGDEDDATKSPDNPFLVKLDNNNFLVIWSYGDDVYYVKVDAKGAVVSGIYQFENAELSDCDPVLMDDGRILWYTWNDDEVKFYSINSKKLSETSATLSNNGHDFKVLKYATQNDNTVRMKCEKCGKEETFTAITSIGDVYWNDDGGNGSFWSVIQSKQNIGTVIIPWVYSVSPDTADNTDYEVISSDPSIIKVTNEYRLLVMRSGTCTITIRPKYNPSNKQTWTFEIPSSPKGWVQAFGN